MLSKKSLKEFKKIYKKEFGEEISDQEAFKQGTNLVNLFKLLYEVDHRERGWKKKLEENPKGFHLTDGSYSCCICGQNVSGDNSWYDQNGIKCLLCQEAIEDNIIPPEACHNKDSWYAIWEFDYYFKMKSATVRKFIRQGKLKARIILNENGRTHLEILMIKENPDVLPAKPKSHLVRDGKGMCHIEYEEVKLNKLLK
ncbi:MAG: hypothetical protein WC697_01195 [Patescibacteria group bacterium]|jgi:hypothetical protein